MMVMALIALFNMRLARQDETTTKPLNLKGICPEKETKVGFAHNLQ